jgi:LemA protein
MTGLVVLGVVALATVGFGAWLWTTYNRLVQLDVETAKGWAQVETELQQRLDLVPNLVSTVQGYADHENGTLTAVIQARSSGVGSSSTAEAIAASGELTQALGRLMLLSEDYPQLAADKGFRQLQDELSQIERRIALGRRIYNENVRSMNTAVRQFPTVLVAPMFGMTEQQYFESRPEAWAPPQVSFGSTAAMNGRG